MEAMATLSFGFLLQHLHELVVGRLRHLVIFRRLGAGNVLLHVGRGQIQAGGREVRIEFHGFLEALDRFRILRVLERLHAFVQLVARLELACSRCQQGQRRPRTEH